MNINSFKILFAALAASVLAVSCGDKGIDDGSNSNYTPPANVGFLDKSYVSTSIAKGKYDLTVLKSGIRPSTVTLTANEEALEAYNDQYGTKYAAIPDEMFNAGMQTLDFSADDTHKNFEIEWDGEDVMSLGRDKDYVIVAMLSADDSSELSDIKRFVVIQPTLTTISMGSSTSSISPNASREEVVVNNSITLNNPEEVDVTINYAVDNTLIDAYNLANGSNYVAAPTDIVSLLGNSSTILAGQLSTTLTLRLLSAPLFNGNVLKAVPQNNYLIPIRITSLSVDGVAIENGTMYVPVEMVKEVKGPWAVLEGNNLCYAKDPSPQTETWASGFTAEMLFNGNYDIYNDWVSLWYTMNTFPMTFVADMGATRVFTKFRIADSGSYQGTARNYEIYTAETYNGPSTQWNLVASGVRDYNWYDGYGAVYDYPVQNMIAGRYLKFVIVNNARDQSAWTGDFINGRCKLGDVFGMGF